MTHQDANAARQATDETVTRWDVDSLSSWGRTIEYFGGRKFCGWTTPHPQVGDEFVVALKGGGRGVFLVTDVCRRRVKTD